jgi:nucleotide-binding universal stress UspA family protein
MYDNILIPTDGTDETRDAVTAGIELASQHGSTVHILHVVENPMLQTALAPRSIGARAQKNRETGEHAVADLQSVADEHDVESVSWVLRARPSLVRSCAHEVIVEYAETNAVDLIVMGTSGRGYLSTLLRPSVTHRVMAATDVPVFGRRLSRDPGLVGDEQVGGRTGPEATE